MIGMPAEPAVRDELPIHALDVIDEFARTPGGGWMRLIVFCYDGDEFPFTFEAINARTEQEAREKLYAEGAMVAARNMFLKTVKLETKH